MKKQKDETFEDSLSKLEDMVGRLERGEAGLEGSLDLFEKGVALAKELTQRLEEAKSKIEVLTQENGKSVRRPFKEKDAE
jgi:exodeoxyribonuclease VII small subunit